MLLSDEAVLQSYKTPHTHSPLGLASKIEHNAQLTSRRHVTSRIQKYPVWKSAKHLRTPVILKSHSEQLSIHLMGQSDHNQNLKATSLRTCCCSASSRLPAADAAAPLSPAAAGAGLWQRSPQWYLTEQLLRRECPERPNPPFAPACTCTSQIHTCHRAPIQEARRTRESRQKV